MTRTSSRGWVVGVTAAASFMVALDTLVVSTALNTIRLESAERVTAEILHADGQPGKAAELIAT